MVVCKCRKATKLYCFVHKVPVCGECICFPEHQICVVRTYSEWVVDGDYNWPPSCCLCHAVIEEGHNSQTTRLGCLHIIHTTCLVSHIKGFPPHTAPAGYVCPACSIPIWPPKFIKDSGSQLHARLKEVIMQSGLEKNLFGNHPVSSETTETRSPPPAFASDPLLHIPAPGGSSSTVGKDAEGYPTPSGLDSDDMVEIVGPTSHQSTGPGATTRKSAFPVDWQSSDDSYYADDEEANRKYTRRGTFRDKFLRALLPFWSSALPTLPVTAPPQKDASNTDNGSEGRKQHQRSSQMDPRKILLFVAIMSCVATMSILYFRLAQGGLDEDLAEADDEP